MASNSSDIRTVRLEEIPKYSAQYSALGSDYIFSRLTKTNYYYHLKSEAMRLDKACLVLCVDGNIDIEANMESLTLTPGSMLIIGNGSVVNVKSVDWDRLDAYMFVISNDFLREINLDLSLVGAIDIASMHPIVLSLTAEETQLMGRYLELIHHNTTSNTDPRFLRCISRSLTTAAAYQLMQFAVSRAMEMLPAGGDVASRRTHYVREFMLLVGQYHNQHRNVSFYADQLKITPKYLSTLVKESTGKSAAELIDEYVVQQAKNLLRYTDNTVQQVAFALNFNSQSSFGKYFKHLTGLSPLQFRKS